MTDDGEFGALRDLIREIRLDINRIYSKIEDLERDVYALERGR